MKALIYRFFLFNSAFITGLFSFGQCADEDIEIGSPFVDNPIENTFICEGAVFTLNLNDEIDEEEDDDVDYTFRICDPDNDGQSLQLSHDDDGVTILESLEVISITQGFYGELVDETQNTLTFHVIFDTDDGERRSNEFTLTINHPKATITAPLDGSIFCYNSSEVTIETSGDMGDLSINEQEFTGNNIDPSSLDPGEYMLIHTLTDTSNCSDTDTIDFTIAQLPSATIIPSSGVYCGSLNDTLTVQVDNGSGDLEYEWTGGTIVNPETSPSLDASSFSNDPTTDVLSVNFEVTITDENSCMSEPDTAVFQVLPIISGVESLFDETFLCNGESFEFSFSNPNGFNESISNIQVTSINPENVIGLPELESTAPLDTGFVGTVGLSPDNAESTATLIFTPYTLIDGEQCFGDSISQVEISVRPLPDIGIISSQEPYCFGDTIEISSGLSEGVGLIWEYENENSELLEINSSDESLFLSLINNPSSDFEFDVSFTVTLDSCSNTSEALPITVYSRPELSADFTLEDKLCEGDNVMFNCQDLVAQNTGTGDFICSIQSSNPDILSEISQPEGLSAGSSVLTISVEDSKGCITEFPFNQEITVADSPELLEIAGLDELCAGIDLTIENQISTDGEFDQINWNYSESLLGEQVSDNFPFTFQVSSTPGSGTLSLELESTVDENLSCFSDSILLDIPVIANVAFGENQSIFVCENEKQTISLDPIWNGTETDDEDDIPISWSFSGGINASVDTDDYSLQISPPFTDGSVGEISGGLAGCALSSMNFEVILFEAPQTEILNEIPLPCDGHEVVYSAVLDDEDVYDYFWNLECDDCESSLLGESGIFIQWNNSSGIGQNANLSLLQSISYEEANGLTCSREETVDFNVSPNSVSCPQGLIYLPPNLLFAEDQLADHYQWYSIENGVWSPIPDALDSPYYAPSNNITSCEDGAQQYGVGAWKTGMNECEVRFSYCFDQNFTDCVTNIKEENITASLSIYPNPTNGDVIFINYSDYLVEESEITIFNSVGKAVLQESHSDFRDLIELDIKELGSGLYHLVISGNSSRISEQFIIID